MGAQIVVFSGGSGQPALDHVAAAFEKATGNSVKVFYNDDPGASDVMVMALDALEQKFRPAGRVEDGGIPIGRAGVGIAVRSGAAIPKIANVNDLDRALLGAKSVLITKNHSTGIYNEGLFKRMGVYDRIEPGLERHPTGPAVMERLLAGSGDEMALLPANEIQLWTDKGIVFVGPLPEEVQAMRQFLAVPTKASTRKDLAWEFARFCGGPGRPLLLAHGFL